MTENSCGPIRWLVWVCVAVCVFAGCDDPGGAGDGASNGAGETTSAPIVAAARARVGKTVIYDASYVGLDYPGGDVPDDTGVCTDVIVRALREGMGMDLQKLIHEDMTAAFGAYPKHKGQRKPDRNIDHRRTENLRRYFARKGYEIEATTNKEDYLPGDLVTCTVGNRPHIMVVSDAKADDGAWLVIHNIGSGTAEEEGLFAYPITGHYRIPLNPVE